jgi:AraC-like DNA-binding protein
MTSIIRRCVEYEDNDAPMRRVEVPTLGVALILSFGPTMRVDGRTVSSFLVGMWDKPALTEHDGEAHGIQIDLAPAVAYALVGGQMDELTNRVLDISDLDVLNVDRLLETGGAAAADELTNAVQHGPSVSREVSWAFSQLQRHPSTRIAWLADEIGWSRSHLVSRFRREVGLSPKRFARVARFRSAFDRLATATSLATVAAECGYADQSHLTHEFREMAGETPSSYQATFVQDGT